LICPWPEVRDIVHGRTATFAGFPPTVLTFSLLGLDYYTGVIYEVVTEGSAPALPATEEAKAKVAKKKGGKPGDAEEDRSDDPTVGIGSVAAGGRLVASVMPHP